MPGTPSESKPTLVRQMGLFAVIATGVSSMVGASINVVPVMIHRSVPGIGSHVVLAFLFAAVPAVLAGLAYAILGSAMPRAGGSYLYASRGLNPYLGFAASFSQWFGLSIVIGVIAYISVPFLRDIALSAGLPETARYLDLAIVRVTLALGLIWGFVYVNVRGVKSYARWLLPMVIVIFATGGIVILSGLFYDSGDFLEALRLKEDIVFTPAASPGLEWPVFLSAAAVLFSSFIGFDAIAQTGSEAVNPKRNLPLATLIAILGVGGFYLLFTLSVYHIVPWSFVAERAQSEDITAPGLLSRVLPKGVDLVILLGAAIALINDLPAMLLSVSRLMFAWARDGIFPERITRIHPKYHSPHIALFCAGVFASIGVLGSHFAGDFFLGIDIMVTSMLVNFLLMCLTVIAFPKVNGVLYRQIAIFRNRTAQLLIGWAGVLFISLFLAIHIYKDLNQPRDGWYFHSTYVWLIVMGLASAVFILKWISLRRDYPDLSARFKKLPNS
ncbi:APC family permease [Robiginitalea sp. SC105]|uniref:APC family permease n=1 Tax=Robiginitalea sp. SC105 TaxID=2762332 RepID=UPI001639BD5F|nr:APC family permease [Robiginitalea sp. SC105]MBC2838448.1 APC family permease [Robiginitalea sp. SC105]